MGNRTLYVGLLDKQWIFRAAVLATFGLLSACSVPDLANHFGAATEHSSTPQQDILLPDWLFDGQIYKAKPKIISVSEHADSSAWFAIYRDTLWANSVAGGIEPKTHDYFMFRKPRDASCDAFEMVFFGGNQEAFFVRFPWRILQKVNPKGIVFLYSASGAGEGGSVVVRTRIEINFGTAVKGRPAISASIEEETSRASIWRLLIPARDAWSAQMEFEALEPSPSMVEAANREAIDLKEYNKLKLVPKAVHRE